MKQRVLIALAIGVVVFAAWRVMSSDVVSKSGHVPINHVEPSGRSRDREEPPAVEEPKKEPRRGGRRRGG